MSFELRELHHADGCNALSFGDAAFTPLKTFLRREAKKLHQEHLARTFVLVPQGETKVLAYITTLCTHVAVEQLGQRDDVLDAFRYKDYPAKGFIPIGVNHDGESQTTTMFIDLRRVLAQVN